MSKCTKLGVRGCDDSGDYALPAPQLRDSTLLGAKVSRLGGCTAVPQSWAKKMNNKFGVEEAPGWWSGELATWANNQRTFAKAFKKPASERSKAEKTFAGQTTERRVALLHGIGLFT